MSPINKPRYVCKAERAMGSADTSDNPVTGAVVAPEKAVNTVRGRRLNRRTGSMVTGSRLKF